MSKPRVLIFSLAYFPFVGGAEVAVKELVGRLAGQFEFEIISANVKNFWSKYFFPFWAYREAARRHRKQKYDLIWAIMANQAGMAAALFKRRYPEIPFLLTLQEGDDLNSLAYRLRLLGPKFFKVFQRADQIQAISHYLADWAKKMGATCLVTVIPNGVDLKQFKLEVKSQQPKANPIIITTSRLVYKNGVDDLIRALTFLPDHIKLQILGAGPEKTALKRLVSNLGLASRVSFLGQVKSSEVGQYLSGAMIFARPSRSEGLGNSFLEAMAAGLPVIGTPVGGIPDFLFDSQGETLKPAKVSPLYQTGWFCEIDNPKSVAEKVGYILDPDNQSQVVRVVSAAQSMVERDYSWLVVAQKLATMFNQLI